MLVVAKTLDVQGVEELADLPHVLVAELDIESLDGVAHSRSTCRAEERNDTAVHEPCKSKLSSGNVLFGSESLDAVDKLHVVLPGIVLETVKHAAEVTWGKVGLLESASEETLAEGRVSKERDACNAKGAFQLLLLEHMREEGRTELLASVKNAILHKG